MIDIKPHPTKKRQTSPHLSLHTIITVTNDIEWIVGSHTTSAEIGIIFFEFDRHILHLCCNNISTFLLLDEVLLTLEDDGLVVVTFALEWVIEDTGIKTFFTETCELKAGEDGT